MKTNYFTEKNIRELSLKFIKDILNIRKHHKFNYNIKNSALIILDMQKFFLDNNSHAFIPSSNAIIKNINNLILLYKYNNRPIIFTKHINTEENAYQMKKWWKDIIKKDSEFSELTEKLDSFNSIIIEKSQYDAFYKTKLENILKENNVEQIVVTGVMTHLCCETTIRTAFVKGFKVYFPVDATATYNEKFHCASLMNLAHGFCYPLLTEEIR